MKLINIIKYKLVRSIEKNPTINLLIYNNIRFFKFLLPHEKDFLGMKLVCKNIKNEIFLDIGANLGISTMGFRQMGFVNKIYIFEPNYEIYKKYLIPLKKKNSNIYLKNYALGDKNQVKSFFVPYFKNNPIHYFGSFDKKYIVSSIKMTFPKLFNQIIIKKKKIKIRKFDNSNINIKPHFIKIDVEGYDHVVIKGLMKTINKYNPIILVEYNVENFHLILKYLRNYKPYVYNIKDNNLLKLKKYFYKTMISRSNKSNLLSNRNIFFIPNE